jgi:glucosamine-6-phosphate deaminase
MRVVVVPDACGVGRAVADMIDEAAPSTLGIATGSSPESTYHLLVERRSLSPDTVLCLLDEYVGLSPDHPARYRRVIDQQLAAPLGLTVVAPDVDADDLGFAAAEYESRVRALGVDIQLLGIGRNGHIGFNEPGAAFTSTTRVVDLSPTTRLDNARFFAQPEDVPTRAITQGLATIAAAGQIIVIAIGSAKSGAVSAMLRGPVDRCVPATILRDHPDVVVVADPDALGGP